MFFEVFGLTYHTAYHNRGVHLPRVVGEAMCRPFRCYRSSERPAAEVRVDTHTASNTSSASRGESRLRLSTHQFNTRMNVVTMYSVARCAGTEPRPSGNACPTSSRMCSTSTR